jgi:hypothetical protein
VVGLVVGTKTGSKYFLACSGEEVIRDPCSVAGCAEQKYGPGNVLGRIRTVFEYLVSSIYFVVSRFLYRCSLRTRCPSNNVQIFLEVPRTIWVG